MDKVAEDVLFRYCRYHVKYGRQIRCRITGDRFSVHWTWAWSSTHYSHGDIWWYKDERTFPEMIEYMLRDTNNHFQYLPVPSL